MGIHPPLISESVPSKSRKASSGFLFGNFRSFRQFGCSISNSFILLRFHIELFDGNNDGMNSAIIPALKQSWIIAGPTASGKSDLAMALAAKTAGEIVAVDSMTLFRRLDIGTAKPSHEERKLIPHHLIDVYEPTDSSNVADWLDKCRQALDIILNRGRTPILCGGTGLYWKALFFGLPKHPPGSFSVREKLGKILESNGMEALHRKLAEVDPYAASRIARTDARRLIRALEVWEITGKPISDNRPDWHATIDVRPEPPARWIWLKWPREILHNRIAKRVIRMFSQGWEAEVAKLEERCEFGPQSGAAIGYKTIRQAKKKGASQEELIKLVEIETRKFAKRQETWFRSLPMIEPFAMDAAVDFEKLAEKLLGF